MKIEKLYLYNFKNACEETLTFAPGVNVIYGENASGKTNLLEALFYFASGKSFRGGKERELIRLGETKAKAELIFSARGLEKKMSLALEKGKKRELFVGGIKQTLQTQLFFQLLKGHMQIAHTIRHQAGAVKLISTVTGIDGNLAHGNNFHTVIRAEAQPHGITLEHDAF